MAVIHISEAEAARDLHALLAEVRRGAEIIIDGPEAPVAVLRQPDINASGSRVTPPGVAVFADENDPPLRAMADVLQALRSRASTSRLPPGFAEDVMSGITERAHESLGGSWE